MSILLGVDIMTLSIMNEIFLSPIPKFADLVSNHMPKIADLVGC